MATEQQSEIFFLQLSIPVSYNFQLALCTAKFIFRNSLFFSIAPFILHWKIAITIFLFQFGNKESSVYVFPLLFDVQVSILLFNWRANKFTLLMEAKRHQTNLARIKSICLQRIFLLFVMITKHSFMKPLCL